MAHETIARVIAKANHAEDDVRGAMTKAA